MKSILEEVSFKNLDIDVNREKEKMGLVLEGTFIKKNKIEEMIHLAMPTSPPSVFVEKIENPNSGRSAMSGRSL